MVGQSATEAKTRIRVALLSGNSDMSRDAMEQDEVGGKAPVDSPS